MSFKYTNKVKAVMTQEMLDECYQNDITKLRISKHASPEVLIKWEGANPSWITDETIYTDENLNTLLTPPNWVYDDTV